MLIIIVVIVVAVSIVPLLVIYFFGFVIEDTATHGFNLPEVLCW